MMSRKPLLFLLCGLLLIIAGSVSWYLTHETPQHAADALAAQGIEVNADNFILAALGKHEDNVRHFIVIGMNAGTQNVSGLSALAAAAESGSTKILKLVMATLPAGNEAEVIKIFSLQDSLRRNAVIAATQSGNENILSMLIAAVASDPGAVKKLVNVQDSHGATALHYAALKGNPALVSQLAVYGADAAITNNDLETPLIIAIKLRHDTLLPALINADKNEHQQKALSVQIPDSTGATPLTYAIQEQNVNVVKTLLEAQADVVSYDRRGTTPLMVAAEAGNQPIAEMLIAAGAKPDVADRFGNTPLIIAIRHARIEFAKFLLSKGADPDFHTTNLSPLQTAIETEPFDSDFFNALLARSKQIRSLGTPFLFAAAERKNVAIMKTLLDAGLSAKAVNEKGETLLYHAIESGNEDMVLLLIDKGADVTQTGIAGLTPLELATERNESRVVKKLLSMDVAFNEKTASGYTVAEIAVYQGHPEILEMLLAKGAVVDPDFCTLWAIHDGHGKSVGVLLAHGANPNVMNQSGETALWLAAEGGEIEAIQALIAHHALMDYRDKRQGMTPLVIASHNGQLTAVKLLVEAGAKMELKDNYGMTALAHAAFMGKPDVVEYLIGKGADTHAVDAQGRSIIDLAALAEAADTRSRIIALLQKK